MSARLVIAALALTAAGSAITVTAQEGERLAPTLEVVHGATPHDAIFGMRIDGMRGMAVGHHGVALRTADGGGTWEPVAGIDTDSALLGVAIAGQHVLIVGQEGLVLRSDDGETFEQADSGTPSRLLNVSLAEDGRAFIVGEFGLVLRSADYGATWEQLTIDWGAFIDDQGYEPHLYDVVSMPDGRIFIAGEFGMVIASSDNGETWTGYNRGEESIFDLHINLNGRGFAVGQNGLVLRTADGGESWERLNVPTEGNLLGVWSSPFDEVVIAGIRTLLRSSDSGATWRVGKEYQIIRSWYQGISAGSSDIDMGRGTLTAELVYVGGAGGVIARVSE